MSQERRALPRRGPWMSGRIYGELAAALHDLDQLAPGTQFFGTAEIPVLDDEDEPATFEVTFEGDRHYAREVV